MNYVFAIFLFCSLAFQSFQWMSFTMIKRTTSKGVLNKSEARIYYHSEGNMVTKFISPFEMYVLNDLLGDVQIYNPASNTVIKSLDNRLGSQSATFYNFLFGEDDLGLKASGFVLKESRVEDMMLVSDYVPPSDFSLDISKVELVSDGEKPVFMGYLDKDSQYIRKIFYYDYAEVLDVQFPKSITEIVFFGSDSTITKTTFSDFQFDVSEDLKYVEYQVPDTAILSE